MINYCKYKSSCILKDDPACVGELSGAVFVRNPINRELVATFEIIVSVHDNASDVIDKSGSVPNGQSASWGEIQPHLL